MAIDLGLTAAIAIAGGLGAVLRLWFGRFSNVLPVGTLLANIVAGLAVAVALIMHGSDPTNWLVPVIMTGLAGGLSTFSGVIGETSRLLIAGNYLKGLGNLALNLVVPALAVWMPIMAVGLLVK